MLYKILLFAHVMGAILWFGAGTLFQIMSERVVKTGDATRMKDFIRTGSLVPPPYFGALTALVLGSGIWLVLETGYGFEQPFVVGGIAGLIASAGIGGAVIGRTSGSLLGSIEAGTITDSALGAGVLRLRNIGRLDAALMTTVVFLMTVKPGT